jgi:hypothetical protein
VSNVHRTSRLLGLLLALLLIAACGGNQPATAPEPTATSVPPTATSAPPTATTAPTTEAAEAGGETDTAGAETSGESEPSESETAKVFDVAGATSYRTRMSVQASGEAFKDEEQTNIEFLGEYTKEPAAQHITIKAGESATDTLEVIQIGDKSWVKFGGNWITDTSGNLPDFTEGLTPFDVSEVEQELDKMERVGNEEINGFQTTHYRFNKETLTNVLREEAGKENIEKLDVAEGNFYVAEEGFLVKWDMQMKGKGIQEDQPDLAGEISINFEVYDLNAEVSIAPPDIPPASGQLGYDFPLPEGATQAFVMEGLGTFEAPGVGVKEAAEFFQKELPALGFEATEGLAQIADDNAVLGFQGNDLEVTITISAKEDGSEIVIATTKKPE